MSIVSNLGMALRRKAALVALATLGSISLAPAYAAQVTLTGVSTNTCTYSAVAVNGTGDLTVTCTGGSSPGTLGFNPTSYNVNVGATFPVTVVRTGGTVGDVSALITATGNCTIPGSNVASFLSSDGSPKTVDVLAGALGNCTISGVGTGTTFSGTASVSVNDPNAPGNFAFQIAASNATTGVSNHTVRVLRTGGSFGAYAVNFSAVPLGLTDYSATVSPLSFASGDTFKDITITTGTTAGTVTFALAGTTPSGPTAVGSHVVSINAPSNCPIPGSNVTVLPASPAANSGKLYSAPTAVGSIISIPIPPTMTRLRTFNSSQTPSNFNVTFSIAQCPGVVQSTWLTSGATPCRKQAGYTGNSLDVTMVPTFAKCHWTAAERATGGYYMNIRIDNCDSGVCSFMYQMDY